MLSNPFVVERLPDSFGGNRQLPDPYPDRIVYGIGDRARSSHGPRLSNSLGTERTRGIFLFHENRYDLRDISYGREQERGKRSVRDLSLIQDNFLAAIIGAVLLAMFGTNLIVILSANALLGIAVIALIVLVAQYLTDMSYAESAVVLLLAWIIGIYFIQNFIW